MIDLNNVSKKYGERLALRPTTHCFEDGKTTVLIGQSGCGKSTMLRLIMGLIHPTTGEIRLNGKVVQDWVLARQSIGYVVQDGGLFPHLSAFNNVTLMAKHLNWSDEDIKNRVHELSSLTRFPEDGLARFPGELSGGQRQRVSLMRALMLKPNILMLDEPLAALDPMVRSALQGDLKDIFDKLHQTVIFVTHDMAEAGFLGDELILMNEGEIIQRGSLEDLRDRPATEFVKAFISAQRSLVAL